MSKVINYLLSMNISKKKILLIIFDILFSFISINISIFIANKEIQIDKNYLLLNSLSIILLLFTFFKFDIYSSFIRYAGHHSLINYIKSIIIYSIILIIFFEVLKTDNYLSYFLIFHCLFLIMLIPSFRFFLTSLINVYRPNYTNENLLIYGAGKLGSIILKASRELKKYQNIFILDDDQTKVGRVLDGVKIFSTSNILKILNETVISEAIIASNSIKTPNKEKFINLLSKYKIKIRNAPSIYEVNYREFNYTQLKNFSNYDIIGSKLDINISKFEKSFSDKTILITGGGGSIGSELVRQIAKLKYKKIIVVDISEFNLFNLKNELNTLSKNLNIQLNIEYLLFDIKDKNKLESLLSDYSPNIIFHTAAYKHVSLVEANPIISMQNNFIATVDFVDLSIKYKVEKFIYVSTDKAVCPKNLMGVSKRLSELYIQQSNIKKKYSVVRFGNVVGSSGSVIPIFLDQIRNGGPITVTHENATRYFMTIPDAALLILNASHISAGGEIFILDMGKPKKIIDIANYLKSLSYTISAGKYMPEDIKIEFIGLQKGEKLHEEIFNKQQQHQLIDDLIFTTFDRDGIDIHKHLPNIKKCILDNDIVNLKILMKKIFPSLVNY